MTRFRTILAVALAYLAGGTATAAATSFADRLFAPGADITSTDTARTALGVRGREAGLGTAKISHEPSAAGATDPNASSLSLRQEGVDTQTQAIFSDAPNSRKVKILNLRAGGVEVLTLAPNPVTGVYELKLNGKLVQTTP